MVLEGASTSPFVCAALGVGRGEAANSTTVRGLGGLVGVLGEVSHRPIRMCRLDVLGEVSHRPIRYPRAESIAPDIWEWHKSDDVTFH